MPGRDLGRMRCSCLVIFRTLCLQHDTLMFSAIRNLYCRLICRRTGFVSEIAHRFGKGILQKTVIDSSSLEKIFPLFLYLSLFLGQYLSKPNNFGRYHIKDKEPPKHFTAHFRPTWFQQTEINVWYPSKSSKKKTSSPFFSLIFS